MSKLAIAASLSFLLSFAGCPDPGGDGPFFTDADTTAPNDAGGADDAPAAADDGVTAPDLYTPPDAGACAENALRCNGNTVEVCIETTWKPTVPCPVGSKCHDGDCIPGCKPECSGKECGDDDCGGSCGTCPVDYGCDEGQCVPVITCWPDCAGKQCGDDGCDGSCGECPPGFDCVAFQCVSCSCAGKQCGDDGCGQSCGTCPASQACVNGQCQGGGGDVSECMQIYNCFGACTATSACINDPEGWECGECINGCLMTGSFEAQDAFINFYMCLYDNMCETYYCFADYCSYQAAACTYESSGAGSCADIQACVAGCATSACLQACGESGSPTAQAEYLALTYCTYEVCPSGDPFCMSQAMTSPQCSGYLEECLL